MRTVARRSIQAIERRIQFVGSLADSKVERRLFVRKLSGRVSPACQLFIVTLNSGIRDGDVIPFAETAMNNQKLRYVARPMYQYPQYVDGNLPEQTETATAQYMENHKKVGCH